MPDELLKEPTPWKVIEKGATWRDLAINYVENQYTFETNADVHRALQRLIIEFRKLESTNRPKEKAPNKSLQPTGKAGG